MFTRQNQQRLTLLIILVFAITGLAWNLSSGEPPHARKPDLVIRNLEISPNPVQAGQEFSVKWSVVNEGNAMARRSTARIKIGTGDWVWACEVSMLFAGKSHDCAVPAGTLIAPSQPGDYPIVVMADADDKVAESDEQNNKASVDLKVQ
jgi:subtilase family serine protease